MKMKPFVVASLLAATLTAPYASAHRFWVKPTTTTVAKTGEWISFDGAIANGIFFPDHVAMPLDRLSIMAPNGDEVPMENAHKLAYRSVFDLQLNKTGTYKIYNSSRSLMASWTDAEGERQRWPGRGEIGTKEDFEKVVPKDADDLKVIDVARRVNVFVTAGAPTDNLLQATGEGLELMGETHPNDLYTGEALNYQLMIDGKPAVGASVVIVREGERYRDTEKSLEITTDEDGRFSVTLNEPGMYWLEADYEDDKGRAPATIRQGNYVTTFEVLPL